MTQNNLTLMTDLYQLMMMQGYYVTNKHQKKVVFDLYFRSNPFQGGYAIAAGLSQAIEYIKNLSFTDSDLDYLRSKDLFLEDFLQYLMDFAFTGNIDAIPEGTVVFPSEPLLRITAPIIEAQLIETALLNIINHQTLIATKASRVVFAADGSPVMEFGLRRAQGPDAGIYGARAAVIGGCSSTSNVLAGKLFNIPVAGTQAHSWIMSFDDEITAFREYAKLFASKCLLLVDTYDTLKSGVPNAIQVFKEMRAQNVPMPFYGIRLDSGDLAYLSQKARKMLDDAGFQDAIISASCDLDENIIAWLKLQGAAITLWGVGTHLITSKDCPALGGIYKLAAEEGADGELVPKIKLSENPDKITNPGVKKVVRVMDRNENKIKADLIMLTEEETNDCNRDLTIFHPLATWKKMTFKAGTYTLRELLTPVFTNGVCVYESPGILEIQAYCRKELDTLWPEYKRLINPHILPVDLSEKLYTLKKEMIEAIRL